MPKLSMHKWSFKYDKCKRCKRTSKEHQANGLCHICYNTINWSKQSRDNQNFGGNRNAKLKLNPICEICNEGEDIVVHHKDRNKKNNNLSNFVTLCRSCHSGLHKYFKLENKFRNFKNLIR